MESEKHFLVPHSQDVSQRLPIAINLDLSFFSSAEHFSKQMNEALMQF